MAKVRSRSGSIKQGFLEVPGGQIHYLAAGEGPNLVLLHLTTSSSDGYADIIPILATRYKVIAMDRFGHGGSDEPPDGLQIEHLVDTVIHFLDALGMGRSHILGQHTGSYEAIEVAIAQPERVAKLVLVGVPNWTPEERAQRVAKDFEEMEYGIELKMDGSHLKGEWEFRVEHTGTPATTPEIMHRIVMASIKSTRARRNISIAVAKHDISKRLPLVRAPILFMSGEYDRQMGDLNRQSSLLPPDVPTETAVIKGAGNYAAMEKPEEFARLVMDFLAKP